jgi:DNA-binding SARP family transcriptional activator
MLELRVLGQFEVRVNDGVVLLASRPAQSLLAYLALSAGTAHRREKLAGLFWPETDDDNARANLRHALWRIRKAVEAVRVGRGYLVSDELAVAFDAGADYWLDAGVLVADGDAVHALQNSLTVYRGELLPGFYDEWVAPNASVWLLSSSAKCSDCSIASPRTAVGPTSWSGPLVGSRWDMRPSRPTGH